MTTIKTGKTTQGRTIPLLVAQEEKSHRELSATDTSQQAEITKSAKLMTFVAFGADVRLKFGDDPTASNESCSFVIPNGQVYQLENDNTYTQFAYQAISGTGTLFVTEI
jgi:hypothetical protein